MILSKKATGINLVISSCNDARYSELNIKTSDAMIAIDIEVSVNRTYWIDQKEKVLVCLYMSHISATNNKCDCILENHPYLTSKIIIHQLPSSIV